MMYKKVYVEITNSCNLKCHFCLGNKREIKYMKEEEFRLILNKLKGYTNYLYFHILGEPLLHPNINEFINLAHEQGYKINLTTNGYFIDKVKDSVNIRQINISLHSYDENGQISLESYLTNIFSSCDILAKKTYINYRLWVNTKYKEQIIDFLEKKYQKKINGHTKLKENIFIDFDNEFIWPNLSRNLNITQGKCYALKDHLGILVDGTVVPCCLDGEGIIKLGNIFQDNLEDIINRDKYQNMMQSFAQNKRIEKLCQNCDFLK